MGARLRYRSAASRHCRIVSVAVSAAVMSVISREMCSEPRKPCCENNSLRECRQHVSIRGLEVFATAVARVVRIAACNSRV
jgi:hypothetical protein